VSNEYVREKKDALDSIAVLFTFVRITDRAEFLEPVLTAVRALRGKLVHPALIRAALACETNVCDAMHTALVSGELPETEDGSTGEFITALMAEMTEHILFAADDPRRSVAAEALACLTNHLNEVGPGAFGDHDQCVRAADAILAVLERRAPCNAGDDGEGSDYEGEE
jgi:hypothetical protein